MKCFSILIFLLLPFFGLGQEFKNRHWSTIVPDVFEECPLYQNSVYAYPSPPLSIAENFKHALQDPYVKIYIEEQNIIDNTRLFLPEINDTIVLSEKDIAYKSAYYRDGYGSYVRYVSDTLATNATTRDTLNGFYKITATGKEYDYYLGYFRSGSPYRHGFSNVFEYYKGNKLVKRRCFRHFLGQSFSGGYYDYDYVEDYYPLTKKKWKRNVLLWPREQLVAQDTVVYKNGKAYVEGIQHIHGAGEKDVLWITQKYGYTAPDWYLRKSVTYKKGKPVAVRYYFNPYDHLNLSTKNGARYGNLYIDLTATPLLATRTYYSTRHKNVVFKGSYRRVEKKGPNCREFDIEEEYAHTDDYFWFEPIGTHYSYTAAIEIEDEKEFPGVFDDENRQVYKNGLLAHDEYRAVSPWLRITDSCTVRNYGEEVEVYRHEVYNYKANTRTEWYYRLPNRKGLVQKTEQVYNGCMSSSEQGDYCNKNRAGRTGSTTTVTCYDAKGKVVFKGSFTDADKINEHDYINKNYEP